MHTDEGIRDLLGLSGQLFGGRHAFLNLLQEIAENFYPERADFTYRRTLGDEFADHLLDSFPVLVRRDLGNAFSSMLRPPGQQWFDMEVTDMDRLDYSAKAWLEWATDRQKKIMYDRASNFTRATKEGDHDFAAFGQAVLEVELRPDMTGLLFRCHSLRDVVWVENALGKVDLVMRKWRPYARDLDALFPGKVHPKITELLKKKPYETVNCQHWVVPADRYPAGAKEGFPFVCLHVDIDNMHLMEAVPSRRLKYVIPRWQTVSGSQYAYSPATIVGLPDARLIQAMTLVLLEAGEKYTNPPMVAVQEVVRSDLALYAGGVTWVDKEYDERLGDALRPIKQVQSGFQYGIEMSQMTKQQITEAFYINKLGLPPMDKESTAFEVGQRVQEYIRQATPLFEPMEMDYNGGICEEVFEALMWTGAFGSPMDIPERLQGDDVEFKFRSPLKDSEGQAKSQKFLEVTTMLGAGMELEPGLPANVDIHTAFRDAMDGSDIPSAWIRDEVEAADVVATQAQAAAMSQALAVAGEAAGVAETAGKAGQELANAETAVG